MKRPTAFPAPVRGKMTAQQQQPRNEESLQSHARPVPEAEVDGSDAALSEAEVAQVKSHIAEALGVGSLPAHEYTGASLYYDASTMASLTPFSLVSLCVSMMWILLLLVGVMLTYT